MMTNRQRADNARATLVGPYADNDVETGIGDLLCDLHHLADAEGIEWEALVSRGNGHYEDECAEERTEPCEGELERRAERVGTPLWQQT